MTTTATDRLLRTALVLGLGATLPGCYLGLYLLGQDLQRSGEWLDGVGILSGLVIVTALAVDARVLPVVLVPVFLLVAMVPARHRRG